MVPRGGMVSRRESVDLRECLVMTRVPQENPRRLEAPPSRNATVGKQGALPKTDLRQLRVRFHRAFGELASEDHELLAGFLNHEGLIDALVLTEDLLQVEAEVLC